MCVSQEANNKKIGISQAYKFLKNWRIWYNKQDAVRCNHLCLYILRITTNETTMRITEQDLFHFVVKSSHQLRSILLWQDVYINILTLIWSDLMNGHDMSCQVIPIVTKINIYYTIVSFFGYFSSMSYWKYS